MSLIKLYPLPGAHGNQPLAIYTDTGLSDPHHWTEIVSWACWQFGCEPEQVHCYDVRFGGPDGDDDSRDVLIIAGDIVGCFDEPLDADDWRALLDADAMQHPRPALVAAPLSIAAE